jgi:DNA-binding transcriptional MerR regulator
MAFKRDKLTKVVDPVPHLTAGDVAKRIAPEVDSDELARTAQRVKHYARDGLIYVEDGGGEGPGRYRRYSDHSVFQAALVQEMKLSGVPVKAIRNAISKMYEKVDSKVDSPIQKAIMRWVEVVHAKYPDREISKPVIYLVVPCADGEAWTGDDLSQAPIGSAQFVFNVAAIFEKVRM